MIKFIICETGNIKRSFITIRDDANKIIFTSGVIMKGTQAKDLAYNVISEIQAGQVKILDDAEDIIRVAKIRSSGGAIYYTDDLKHPKAKGAFITSMKRTEYEAISASLASYNFFTT